MVSCTNCCKHVDRLAFIRSYKENFHEATIWSFSTDGTYFHLIYMKEVFYSSFVQFQIPGSSQDLNHIQYTFSEQILQITSPGLENQ